MSNIIPFESAGLPTRAADSPFKVTLDGVSKGGAGFPVISYKGKVFHLVRGEESKLLTRPDDDDTPAPYIDGVIIGISPGKGMNARTFYVEGYQEGAKGAPTCSSMNGETPDIDAAEAQASKCAVCPQNAVGSGATQQNPKAKACKSHKRVAFAAFDALNDPMLIRVPGDSLSALGEFNKLVASRGFAVQEVITRIGFDHAKAHPCLTFKPISVINDSAVLQKIFEATKLDTTEAILGTSGSPEVEGAGAADEPAPRKEADAPKTAASKGEATAAKATAPKAEAPAEKPKKQKVETPKVVDADEGIADALGDLDFDD